jgi:hypothetical protein
MKFMKDMKGMKKDSLSWILITISVLVEGLTGTAAALVFPWIPRRGTIAIECRT